jgi:hypothetical protein
MSIIISSEGLRTSDSLISQLEYYEAIFEREALVTREGEFRSRKLGLTIELLKIVGIPEDLKTELISTVIEAWRLDAPEKTVEQREDELKMLLHTIKAVKGAANWAREHPSPMIRQQLDVAVMFSLPLMSSDLRPEEVSKVHCLLCKVMDHYAGVIDGSILNRTEKKKDNSKSA